MAPKRKRSGVNSKDLTANDDIPTNSSNGVGSHHVASEDSTDHPSKRSRSSPLRDQGRNASESGSRPSTANAARMPANGVAIGGGENGEAGKMRMDPPPRAGEVDPVGYKTNPPPEGRSVRVYADGVFDMFHLGHMRVLQQAKTAFPDTYLIVGVTGDEETHKRKGLTVMSAKERAESLRHCRWVDEVVEDCPWIINPEFLEQRNIDYVAHDDIPYGASEGDDIYKPIKERGMFLVTQRTEGVSTTGIITKIVRDYEQYIARQLKRGTTRQELNVSWFKKNELELKRHVADLRDTIRTNWTTTGQELSKELKQFWQPSRPASPTRSLRNSVDGTPRSSRTSNARESTPGRERGKNMDFAAGYAMGLIGGVKGWMEGSRRRNLSDSRAHSPVGSDSDARSPVLGSLGRGRQFPRDLNDQASEQLVDEMHR